MSTEDDLEERISKLEQRISHLEESTGYNFYYEKFEARMRHVFGTAAELSFDHGRFGSFARATNIDGDDVEKARRLLDYEYAITETGNGLGMEVWTGDRKL